MEKICWLKLGTLYILLAKWRRTKLHLKLHSVSVTIALVLLELHAKKLSHRGEKIGIKQNHL